MHETCGLYFVLASWSWSYSKACIMTLYICPANCLILLNNHDELWVMAAKLQTEIGDQLTKDDLVVGATVIYKSRGKPYEAEILDVKCKSPLY